MTSAIHRNARPTPGWASRDENSDHVWADEHVWVSLRWRGAARDAQVLRKLVVNGDRRGTAARGVETLNGVVIRFAGDSGDGMQLVGDRFTELSAVFGNDLPTQPDFPAEIRAPAGTIAGGRPSRCTSPITTS